METFKKICKALLFPHIAIMIILVPIAAAFLIYSMVVLGTETVPAYISYVLSAYTLTVWCVRIPKLIDFFKTFKNENKYVVRLSEDVRLRVNISLFGSLIWNTAYAAFQFYLGLYHGSFWFYSMSAYYLSLVIMRFFLAMYTRKHKAGEDMHAEFKKYRACGWVFLFLNLSLTLMIFFMVYWNRTFIHHEITTITMAAYTFTAFTVAIVNMVKYGKYNSPVYSASKAINLAVASVSMLTLTSTMLTTFGEAEGLFFKRIMLGCIGGAVSAFIITMAVYMIIKSTKKLKLLKTEDAHEQ